jgi:hypothetical protein
MLERWSSGTAEDREWVFEAVQHQLRRIAAGTGAVNGAITRRSSRPLWSTKRIPGLWTRPASRGRTARISMGSLHSSCGRSSSTTRAGGGLESARAYARIDSSRRSPGAGGGVDTNDVIALHDALNELATLDTRQAEIVELRYFGGLTEEEVAKVKALSPATIRREIAAARFWFGGRMQGHR